MRDGRSPHTNRTISLLLPVPVPAAAPRIIYDDKCSTAVTAYVMPQPLLATFVNQRGVPDYLINCVGLAHPRYVQELTPDDFRQRMAVNYFDQPVPIYLLLPYFMDAYKGYITLR